MAERTTNRVTRIAQNIPLFCLLGYVGFQWRNLLSVLFLIFFIYSISKNVINVMIDSHKMPKRAFVLLTFFDIWVGLVKLSQVILLDISYSRALLNGIQRLGGKVCPTTEVTIHNINKEIEVYVYKPKTVSNKGCLVYIHGGGWMFLSARGFNSSVSYLAHYLEMVVVSVEYRLAPENPFPAGLTDCYNAVQWVHENSEMLGVETDKIFVGGDSAGGNLSAALSLLYRDRQGTPLDTEASEEESIKRPPLAGQILLYPVMQGFSRFHGSMVENSSYFPPPSLGPGCQSAYACGTERFSNVLGDPGRMKNKVPKFWTSVVDKKMADEGEVSMIKEVKKLAPHGNDSTLDEVIGNSYIFPLHAEDVSNLPPAYVVVATADTLRDEGEWYARYLEQNGNTVVFSEVPHVHGFMMKYDTNVLARSELMKIKEFMKDNSSGEKSN